MKSHFSLDIFCHVIDNYGDAGVCWRLARQFAKEYPVQVRLWIDQIETLKKICLTLDVTKTKQFVSDVEIRIWPQTFPDIDSSFIPDVVIEGFGCRLPDNYIKAMSLKHPFPVWINMEYLSAESWVKDCHLMASPQSTTALTKYFFFPGFSKETGGLIRESQLISYRTQFQQNQKLQMDFLKQVGVKSTANKTFSLFCYQDAPVSALFEVLVGQQEKTVLCLVPEGVASDAVSAFLGFSAQTGATKTHGNLTVEVIPVLDQEDYDKLLWLCDLNFVRGEDSFVRAQWAGKPFVWQIYPQKDNAHQIKLQIFLEHYLSGLSKKDIAKIMKNMWYAWNNFEKQKDFSIQMWIKHLFQEAHVLEKHALAWTKQMKENQDFASSLFRFISSMR